MKKIIFKMKEKDIITEDSGQSKQYEIDIPYSNELFIRLMSWDEECIHKHFNKFKNKKVKITIEIIK